MFEPKETQQSNVQNKLPNWFPVAGVIFTITTIVIFLYLLIRPEDIASSRRTMFNVFVAFCLTASASFLGGTAQTRGKIPFVSETSPIQFVAVGGFAMFIVTLLVLSVIN